MTPEREQSRSVKVFRLECRGERQTKPDQQRERRTHDDG